MKKITLITLITLLSISSYGFSSSQKSPHYLQFVSAAYNDYIDKYVFVETTDSSFLYQGECVAIGSDIITIKYSDGEGIKIMTFPMIRVKKFWRMIK